MFAILQLALILPFGLTQCAAIINKGSFSNANVWEAKKKPTSAKKTIMIKMKGVILK